MKKWIYRVLLVIFAAGFLVSGGILAGYYLETYRQSSRYSDLSAMLEEGTTPRPTPPPVTPEADTPTAPVTEPEPTMIQVTHPETGETLSVLPEFASLFRLNSDIVGWLKIPGTGIDYPVMQTTDRPNFYLTRNFDRETSNHGCLYVQENCDVFTPSDNAVIYGHRMRDGSMFGKLGSYERRDFWESHPDIYFDTLTQLHTYRILAVFRTSASAGEGFDYHTYVQMRDSAEFDRFIATCKALSLYDTGETAQYGDKLITLSTCEYSQTNGRLVVVAKRIA